jgi:copper oxidase (laccase) domain-containing protein
VFNQKPKITDKNIIDVTQQHTDLIVEYEGKSLEKTIADGIILNHKKYHKELLAIKTADCLPISYIGIDKMALVHAGWKGLAKKIHLHKKLLELDPLEILIGPAISKNYFEVGSEFLDYFPNYHHSPFFHIAENRPENEKKYFVDLKLIALTELQEFFPKAKIQATPFCTYENAFLYSHRYSCHLELKKNKPTYFNQVSKKISPSVVGRNWTLLGNFNRI